MMPMICRASAVSSELPCSRESRRGPTCQLQTFNDLKMSQYSSQTFNDLKMYAYTSRDEMRMSMSEGFDEAAAAGEND